MPRLGCLAALDLCRELQPEVPFIIVSGVVGEDTAVDAMRAGARDYVLKGRLARLLPAIERELAERSKRSLAQEQLRQTQKLEAIGRLAGGVAHDFNNLMSVVLTNAGLLASRLADGDAPCELVDDITAASSRAGELAKQLLVFGRTQALVREPLPLTPVVKGTMRLFQPLMGEGIAVSADLSDEAGCVEAHRGQIEQVVMNLVINARDAMLVKPFTPYSLACKLRALLGG